MQSFLIVPCLSLLGWVGQDQPPRLRTLLPNGASVLVERMPSEKTISVQLWAAARGFPERPETHGLRHLLEHLLANGSNGELAARLEASGAFLRARTYRDAMQFEVSAETGDLALALDGLRSVLEVPAFSLQQIAREADVIAQEEALLDSEDMLGAAAWKAAYGDEGLDPLGSLGAIRSASPEALRVAHESQFNATNVVLVIAGPVDLDDATKLGRRLLERLPKGKASGDAIRREGKPGRQMARSFGEARGAIVPAYYEAATVGALAAALAIASEVGGCFVTYTPTPHAGLVVLGRTEFASGLGLFIDALEPASAEGLFERGKALALQWLESQLRSSEGAASLRGMLLCNGPAHRPERMLEAIRALNQAQFLRGVDALREGRAVIAVGA